MSNRSRRKFSSTQKLRIVLEGMQSDAAVATVCRRNGIAPTQYYTWKRQLLDSADLIFKRKNGKEQTEAEKYKEKLRHKDAVIAELTAENLELKKTL